MENRRPNMNTAFLVLVGAALVGPPGTKEQERAIAIVKTVNGQLGFDDKAPGRPVVSLNL